MKILRFPSPKILGLSTVVTLELDLPRYSYFMILENASKNITYFYDLKPIVIFFFE